MNEARFLDLAAQIMPLPTTAFHEHFVIAAVEAFAASRSSISHSRDAFGNILLLYDGGPPATERGDYLIATAHLDHPGLGFSTRLSKRKFRFEKLGGVDTDLALGTSICIYDPQKHPDQKPIKGEISDFDPGAGPSLPSFVVKVAGREAEKIATDSFAMWDLCPFSLKDRRIHSRACDDLAGATAGLAYMDEIARRQLPVRAGLLLTRAEEIGFGGMLAATQSGVLDDKALYINIECSSSKAGAALGGGVVIRVGDLWCIFDPIVSGGLVALAQDLASETPCFRFQRKLMDGGICEATVLVNAALRTGAVALPLDNYHNSGKKRLKPEIVNLDDALGLVDFLVYLAAASGGIDRALGEAQKHLEQNLARRRESSISRLVKTLS